jgi:c(7)-type cytochrome triheme protein
VVSLPIFRRTALAVGVIVAVAVVPAAQAAGPAAPRAPADFTIPKGENSPGTVTFSHARHLVKVHKCSTCHMRDFKLKRGASGPITLEAKQEGKFCGACHDGKTTFAGAIVFPIDQCDACHKD